jgi:hypothetical protein
VGTAVMRNHRNTGVYYAQQWGLVYSRFFFFQRGFKWPVDEKKTAKRLKVRNFTGSILLSADNKT